MIRVFNKSKRLIDINTVKIKPLQSALINEETAHKAILDKIRTLVTLKLVAVYNEPKKEVIIEEVKTVSDSETKSSKPKTKKKNTK